MYKRQSYTRAGLFGLDKEGYVVANNNSRVQGFDANADGVVSGVLGSIQIQVGNQAPALTSRVSAILNLDAGEEVLQEQGLQLVSNGLSIGVADSGIIESTSSILVAAGQPTTAGVPALLDWTGGNILAGAGGVADTGYAAGIQMSFDIGDGNGLQAITLEGVAAGSTQQDVLNDIQKQLNTVSVSYTHLTLPTNREV